MSTTVPKAPTGAVPAIGVPDSQDYPRLVYTAPYFAQTPLAELIEPSVIEAAEAVLPVLVPPYVQGAADAAVDQRAVLLTGSTMSGPLYLNPAIPTQPSQAASMAYVDLMVSVASVPEVPPVPFGQTWARQTGAWVPGLSDAPNDGAAYGRLSQGWSRVLPITGGALIGQLTLAADPAVPLGAATMQYVDGAVNRAGGPFLPTAGGTMTGGLNYTATGGTTSRAAQDRWGALTNVRDFGAVLDGVTADNAAYTAARAAAQVISQNGVVDIPPGKHLVTVSPTLSGNPVLWRARGVTLGVSALPLQNVCNGDMTENFWDGTLIYQRTDATVPPGAGMVRFSYAGPGSSFGALNVTSTPTGANLFPWNIVSQHTIGTGMTSGQSVGVASIPTRVSGSGQIMFGFYSQVTDATGRQLVPGQSVGMEIDVIQSGPEAATSVYQPGLGSRAGINVICKNYSAAAWAANHAYAVNATVQSGGNVFYCTTAGTSGATAPTWPSSGTVTDGTVVWTYGTTVNSQASRAYNAFAPANTSWGCGYLAAGSFYSSVIDICGATLDTVTNPTAAGIRLAAEMPIDFSCDQTLAGQNLHTLGYTTTGSAPRLRYTAGGTELFSFSDQGVFQVTSTVATSIRLATEHFISFNTTDNRTLMFSAVGGNRLVYQINATDSLSISDTNTLTLGNNTAAGPAININGVASSNKQIRWQSAGLNRWVMQMVNVESSGNAGSNFLLQSYDDTGASLMANVLTITRSSGLATFGGALRINGTVGFNNTAPVAKPTVTGAKGSNAALASLMTALAAYGLVTDSTSA